MHEEQWLTKEGLKQLLTSEDPGLRSVLVYAFWLGDRCQYVGKSEHGIERIEYPEYHGIMDEFDYDVVNLQWQPNNETARVEEIRLIRLLDPAYNYVYKQYDRRRSMRKRIAPNEADMPQTSYNPKTRMFQMVTYNPKVIREFKNVAERDTALNLEIERVKAQRRERHIRCNPF